ncbi:hypothetical protein ABEB36_012919 [Hypothenemus hampei]|uniref:Uncharacterized protein n=1 Tax=Hypothenemus hampei TaxID=57062 RepID=A0ABD1E739_HYPHA
MTFILTLSYILIVFLILIFSKLSIINENRIFGKYPRKTKYYWLKVLVMYVILSLRKFFKKVPADYFEKLDKPQQLSPTPKAADAVYFNGVNNKGECLIHGTARRHGLIDGFLYLKINASELGLLELTTLPDTSQIMDTSGTGYEAAGIKVVALKPMKTWKITFNGKLREAKNKDSLHEVSIEAIYTSDKPCFNYETQMEPWNMAKNIAYEKWSRKYFENFNNHHQLHYEQFGVVKANVTIDKQEYRLNVDCLRDHSVASHRDWGSFERYILHWISMENGDHFALGMICNPICYSSKSPGQKQEYRKYMSAPFG